MYLKSIELQGFKSFADRTAFEFGPGITAIVGPNGCGKSNVLDAVRWVLGEQSAKSLRGDKMADVIFSGSRSRKPAPFAEVTLTFDNRNGFLACEQPEVSVGRLLYRNGDSEYRLNGAACRLKDIRDLFLDTGVGVDAYSVIEQGRVDLMLQANPVDRREIFEEAAGISRYRTRRVEAQRKLERSQQNLLRLADVIDELEKRLRSVRLAAGKARNFQQHDARLRELRSSFSLAELHQLEVARAAHGAERAQISGELAHGRATLQAQDEQTAALEQTVREADDALERLELRLGEHQSTISTLCERVSQGTRRLAELELTRDRRRQHAAEIEARAQTTAARIDEEASALEQAVAAEADLAARLLANQSRRAEAAGQVEAARGALEREKVAAFEAVRRTTLLGNQRANVEQQCARVAATIARLNERRGQVAAERDGLAAQRGAAGERLTGLIDAAGGLRQRLGDEDGRLGELRQERVALEEELSAARQARSALASRLGVLEELDRTLEGVDAGTRAVLGWRDDAPGDGGVIGLVADLLRIDDPRVPLLDSVLAAFESHVVVRNAHDFLAELARRGGAPGPLRVLMLDRLVAPPPRAEYDNAPGVLARAADWVVCDPQYRVVAEHVLGRVIVVDELPRALALAAGAPEGHVFVTPVGHAVSSDGRLAHDVVRSASGLISRKTEIRQLRGELDETEALLERGARSRVQNEQLASDAELRRAALLDEIAALQREESEARGTLLRLDEALQRVDREAAAVDAERAAALRSDEELASQLAVLLAEVESAEQARQDGERRVCELEQTAVALDDALAAASRELTDALVARGRAHERAAAVSAALEELRRQHGQLAREQAAAQAEADHAERQMEAAQGEIDSAGRSEAAERAAADQCAEEVSRGRARRDELRVSIDECAAALRDSRRRVDEAEGALRQVEVALREADVRRENLISRVRDELGVELEALYDGAPPAEQDWDAVRAEIDELRQKIARLGHVNLDAIAELDELTPRYENMIAQRGDVSSSIEQLQALITELDDQSKLRFSAAFEQIRAHFQDLFRKLFGGGRADVILENPEAPLECGIEIIARPPGKEPQSISLLSGGEKTMTAVALLMAVFKSHPSPFAILDEVDAALDEANVERFNTLVADFLSQSQFVVITHHKRTMQSADVLYGITMEEPGVSKRVSVRFETRVQTPNVA